MALTVLGNKLPGPKDMLGMGRISGNKVIGPPDDRGCLLDDTNLLHIATII